MDDQPPYVTDRSLVVSGKNTGICGKGEKQLYLIGILVSF